MSPVIVAMDVPNYQEALSLMDALDAAKCRLKVGKELFTAQGSKIVEEMHRRGFEVFLDLKFHDIPNTTAQAVKMAADLGVWMVNVHALGGLEMMHAARTILSGYTKPPYLIAVTLLTSMNEETITEIGLQGSKDEVVDRLTGLTNKAQLDGVVCSANEAAMIKQKYGKNFLTVCPGIRLESAVENDDQKRVMTPEKAIEAGADYLVIGRPITQAKDPMSVLDIIINRLACG